MENISNNNLIYISSSALKPQELILDDLNGHKKTLNNYKELHKLLVDETNILVFSNAKQQLRNIDNLLNIKAKIFCLFTASKIINNKTQNIKEIINIIKIEKCGFLLSLECELIKHLLAIENRGLSFNKAKWEKYLQEIKPKRDRLKNELLALIKPDKGFLLFKEQTETKLDVSSLKDALEKMVGQKLEGLSKSALKNIDHPAIGLYSQFKELSFIIEHYGENFLSRIEKNRLRGEFSSLGSASGRISCMNPNLQALPKNSYFQSMLDPGVDRSLVSIDYAGFELRILAALSQDPLLLEIFSQKKDVHSMVAEAVFKQKVSKEINPHLRDKAKILNFGIVYGMGEQALAKTLNISVSNAQEMLKGYFKKFPKVKQLLESLEQKALNNGYVNTRLGRRLDLVFDDPKNRGHLLRVARNMPIQGTGADIAKLALIKASQNLYDAKLDAFLVNMVHDELVFECSNEHKEAAEKIVKCAMSEAFSLIIPEVLPEISSKNYNFNFIQDPCQNL